jgi:hypothetical protein
MIAPAPFPADPPSTTRAIFRALEDARWSDVAAYVTDESAQAFREVTLMALLAAKLNDMDAFRLLERSDAAETLRRYEVDSLDDLFALPPLALVECLIEKEHAAEVRGPNGVRVRHKVIGHVLEGSDLAHVVYRLFKLEFGEWTREDRVLELERNGELGWRIDSPELHRMLSASKAEHPF